MLARLSFWRRSLDITIFGMEGLRVLVNKGGLDRKVSLFYRDLRRLRHD